METGTSIFRTSAAPNKRSMMTSIGLHVFVMAVLMVVPAAALRPSAPADKELDIIFYRPPEIEVRSRPAPIPRPQPRPGEALAPAPPAAPRNPIPEPPAAAGNPELPSGAVESVVASAATPPAPPARRAGTAGILALRDKFASRAQDRVAPRIGVNARQGAADDIGRPSSPSALTTTTPGGSAGINVAALNRSVGGGGGGTGGGGRSGLTSPGGTGGATAARTTSPIVASGGDSRPQARGGQAAARTDEEIQIVFDRYKAAFYRLYNRELRNNPTLQGQLVLRLTIEPDGSVSTCVLQSSDMNAPDLASQVVSRVRTMNFGAKDAQAVTIVYPIDFLPAE